MAFTKEHPAQVGSTITNGSSALRIVRREERDPHWKCAGWRGHNIPLEAFGGNPGTLGFVPDYLLGSWRHVPFEWTQVTGGSLEERYVWTDDWRRLQREVRHTHPYGACLACGGPLAADGGCTEGTCETAEVPA